jgi:hypothetical protein
MSEEMMNDPLGLGMDLSTVDVSRPCLPEQMHVLSIDSVEVKPNKKETGRNLVVVFKTVNDSPDVTGAKIISAGYPITKYYPLQQSDNEKAPDFKADLARLQDAVEGTKQGERPPFQPFNYVGKLVMARIRIKKDEEYGDSNEIAKLEAVTA